MTQDEIIEMTRQAGGFDATPKFLERFAKLVTEHEREACAKLCDELDQKLWEDMGESMSGYGEAIRERT
jgi:hypothetical protein